MHHAVRRPAGSPQHSVVGGVPSGAEAFAIATLPNRPAAGTILHVACDARHAAIAERSLRFLMPDAEVLSFPAWDCLPYDRAPASRAVVGRRIETLIALRGRGGGGARVVVTTPAAVLQRLPPPEILEQASFRIAADEPLDHAALEHLLERDGYRPVETVREPGQFALHAEIVDLFPAGAERPVRVDVEDGVARRLQDFDPSTQRTIGDPRRHVWLVPVSEVVLTPATIDRFAERYAAAFGTAADDKLPRAVADGRHVTGVAHLLPLFYDRTETLFGYLPDALVTIDAAAEAQRDLRLAQIRDAYGARREMTALSAAARLDRYPALPPDRLYLDAEGWQAALDGRAVLRFAATPGDGGDAGLRPGPDAPLDEEALRGLAAGHGREGRVLLVDAGTRSARAAVARGIGRHLRLPARPVDDWPSARALPAGTIAVCGIGLDGGVEGAAFTVLPRRLVPGRLVRRAAGRGGAPTVMAGDGLLRPGDLVVHADHGIGRFDGLEAVRTSGPVEECLRLTYRGDKALLVPIADLHLVTAYGGEQGVALDALGGADWPSRRDRARRHVRTIAARLLARSRRRRERRTAPIEVPARDYDRFVARFPHIETPDQEAAIAAVIRDLGAGHPMDRLICGDVGFGKTEIAMRAAFLVAASGRQVALVAPTTPLARQHFDDFCARFAGFPFRIRQLSRSVPAREAARIREELATGETRIVVGTHALLGRSVSFRDLGLLIVDEEQRFGTGQKGALRARGRDAHVLTMTATPIPRTLTLALTGVQDISTLATPPAERQPVRSYALPFDPVVVREALLRERLRGGQSFYVCPRIEDLEAVADRLRSLVPQLEVLTVHGKLRAASLDESMAAFAGGAADVLLATNIVESGMNIPNANTLIVHRADMFGLAQLHQLRGRVGRSTTQGYAYLTHEAGDGPSAEAAARLEAVLAADGLGAGMALAARDVVIRGIGDLLGDAQSGHRRDVGAALLQRMLRDETVRRRTGRRTEPPPATVHAGLPLLIPEDYVPDPETRLDLYRRLAAAEAGTVEDIADEFEDRFGPAPDEVGILLELAELRRLAREAGVESIDIGPKGVSFAFQRGGMNREARTMLTTEGCRRSGRTGRLVLPVDGERQGLARATALLRALAARQG